MAEVHSQDPAEKLIFISPDNIKIQEGWNYRTAINPEILVELKASLREHGFLE